MLATLGEDSPEQPMAESAIHSRAQQWPTSRWATVAAYLNWRDAQPVNSEPDLPRGQAQQPERYSHSCSGGNVSVQENENGVYVITVPENGTIASTDCTFANPGLWNNQNKVVEGAYVQPNRFGQLYYFTLPGLTSQFRTNVNMEFRGASRMTISTHPSRTVLNDDVYTGTRCGPVFKFLKVGQDLKFCIEDDESVPVVSFAAAYASLAENGGSQQVGVTISPPSASEIRIPLLLSSSGTATRGTKLNGTCIDGDFCVDDVLVIPARSATADINIDVRSDGKTERDETIILTLSSSGISGHARIGSVGTSTLTVPDGDSMMAEWSACQCVDAAMSQGEACGPGGNQVIVERDTAGTDHGG